MDGSQGLQDTIGVQDIDLDEFAYVMGIRGWFRFENVMRQPFLDTLRQDLQSLYDKRRAKQIENGVADGMEGTAHHLVGDNTAIDRLIATHPLGAYLDRYFDGGKYILNSVGAVLNTKDSDKYVGAVHRDVRSYTSPHRMMINVMVLLDDFTPENGATYILPGSQWLQGKPSDEVFFNYAEQVRGKAGDMIVFDSHMWHAAGANTTDQVRRLITIGFARPYIKAQIDFPRFLSDEFASNLSEVEKQLYGYHARVAESLDEYYQPAENRTYRSDQR